jgi:hypothetical protein
MHVAHAAGLSHAQKTHLRLPGAVDFAESDIVTALDQGGLPVLSPPVHHEWPEYLLPLFAAYASSIRRCLFTGIPAAYGPGYCWCTGPYEDRPGL